MASDREPSGFLQACKRVLMDQGTKQCSGPAITGTSGAAVQASVTNAHLGQAAIPLSQTAGPGCVAHLAGPGAALKQGPRRLSRHPGA